MSQRTSIGVLQSTKAEFDALRPMTEPDTADDTLQSLIYFYKHYRIARDLPIHISVDRFVKFAKESDTIYELESATRMNRNEILPILRKHPYDFEFQSARDLLKDMDSDTEALAYDD